LFNSELSLQQARRLSRSLADRPGSDPTAFIAVAFEQVLCRPPTREETTECLAFLTNRGQGGGDIKPGFDPAQRARESLVHVLMNHNDFVTVR